MVKGTVKYSQMVMCEQLYAPGDLTCKENMSVLTQSRAAINGCPRRGSVKGPVQMVQLVQRMMSVIIVIIMTKDCVGCIASDEKIFTLILEVQIRICKVC
jgi:hypothetical protein